MESAMEELINQLIEDLRAPDAFPQQSLSNEILGVNISD
jgi:hypothetical protein